MPASLSSPSSTSRPPRPTSRRWTSGGPSTPRPPPHVGSRAATLATGVTLVYRSVHYGNSTLAVRERRTHMGDVRMRRSLGAAALAVLLLATACGSSKDDASTTTTAAGGSGSSTT